MVLMFVGLCTAMNCVTALFPLFIEKGPVYPLLNKVIQRSIKASKTQSGEEKVHVTGAT